MAEPKPPYGAPSIERIAPFFATSAAKMPGFVCLPGLGGPRRDGSEEGMDTRDRADGEPGDTGEGP